MSLRALVVDDEPIARAGLAGLLRDDPDFVAVMECGDRDTAVRTIREQRPHLVLLDIQLNPGTGFDVIRDISVRQMPRTIFVTAFDRFALDAFEAAAVDYVLKPVDPGRLCTAIERAKAQVTGHDFIDAAQRIAALASELRPPAPPPIVIADGNRTLLFEPGEIVRIDAADYYANVHARGRAWLVRQSLDAFEARLPRPPFFRIHRSTIVNLRYVLELARESRHRHVVVLRDGARLPVSEERRKALDAWLRQVV